jgi:hypothetical protein
MPTAGQRAGSRSLAARVKGPVGFSQVFPINVSVNLRGGDARVAEHLLYRPQVCPALTVNLPGPNIWSNL